MEWNGWGEIEASSLIFHHIRYIRKRSLWLLLFVFIVHRRHSKITVSLLFTLQSQSQYTADIVPYRSIPNSPNQKTRLR